MEDIRILGNGQLKKNLDAAIARGHISHFYLISGPRGSGKRTLARYLSAAILCTGTRRPCFQCAACRKVLSGSHPDVVVVDDPEKKTVTVGMARDTRADMYIMPNESDHKIYQFPRADDINISAQNALLKILEEPPAYGVFMLLAENPARLLPTIRSRAAELRMQNLPAEVLRPWLRERFPGADAQAVDAAIARSAGLAGQAAEILGGDGGEDPVTDAWTEALIARDSEAMLRVMVPLEKIGRNELAALLDKWYTLTEEALACRYGSAAVSENARRMARSMESAGLAETAAELKKLRLYCDSNVSGGAIAAYLGWKLAP